MKHFKNGILPDYEDRIMEYEMGEICSMHYEK
jgi:hypothetical protein